MHITRLVLRGNIRLWYAGIQEIDYQPESPYQLIVGTNGSGKSSLVAELNPNPGLRQDFHPDGLKRVELEHNGHRYILTSEFSHGAKHTFECDGVLLNDKGTLATQKELVLEHFQYTHALHELMSGETRLSRLTPPQRREWISRACQYDVTYALSLFNKVKALGRDAQGARKHIDARLSTEYANALDPVALDDLAFEVERLSEQVNALQYAVDPTCLTAGEAEAILAESMDTLERITHNVMLPMNIRCLQGRESREAIRAQVQREEEEQRRLDDRVRSLTDDLDTLTASLAKQQAAAQGRGSLQDERTTLLEKLQTLYKYTLPYRYDDIDYGHTHRLLTDAIAELRDRLRRLPENTERLYSPEAMTAARSQHDRLSREHNTFHARRLSLVAHREAVANTAPTDCPQCHYTFIPGIPQDEIGRLDAEIAALDEKLAQWSGELDTCKRWLLANEDWQHQYTALHAMFTPHPSLAGLWALWHEDDLLYTAPAECVGRLDQWAAGVAVLAERSTLEQRLGVIETLLTRAAEDGLDTATYLTDREQTLRAELAALEKQQWMQETTLRSLKRVLTVASDWALLEDRLQTVMGETFDALCGVVSARVNDAYLAQIGESQTRLRELSAELTQGRAAVNEVSSLEAQRRELIEREADYKFLADELSPTTGMIADQLSHCINQLVEQMNALINQVWTYDLRILPCAVVKPDRAELDYRFPIAIRGRDTHVPDIAKGSGAMTVMIDFVFMLVYLSSTGMEGYPLFPDELGATFDPTHRIRVVEFFKRLVESRRTAQIFYISHNPEAHSLLNGADVVVLDDTNVPDVLNANRVIRIVKV